MTSVTSTDDFVALATELTSAWLANPNTTASIKDAPVLLGKVHDAISRLANGEVSTDKETPTQVFTPVVSVRKSLASGDHIISMIDGKPYKTLKAHLSRHGLTPGEYRQRYGLKHDYPMVAPSYAELRRGIAKQLGLGRKRGSQPQPASTSPRAKLSLFAK